MKRRLLAILLAVAMLASSFVALPVFAAEETVADVTLNTGANGKVDFSNAHSGVVTMKFDVNLSTGTGNFRLWFFPQDQGRYEDGNKPYLQITEGGGIHGQGATKVGNLTLGSATTLTMVVDLEAQQYTVAVGNGTASAPVAYPTKIDNIAGFDYKVINEKTATITNITVSSVAAEPDPEPEPEPDGNTINIAANSVDKKDFDKAYSGTVTVNFDLNVVPNSGNANTNFYFYPENGDKNTAQYIIQLSGSQFYAQQATGTDRRITFNQDCNVEFVFDLANSEYTVSINGGAPAGPFASGGAQANIAGIAWQENLGGSATIKNLTVTEKIGATTVSDMNVAAGDEQDQWLGTAYTGDVKISFDATTIDADGVASNGFLYIMKDGGNENGSLNFQIQGIKLWAQAAHNAGRLTSGVTSKIEIYYNTEGTAYTVYVDGTKTGPFNVDAALGNIKGLWLKNKQGTAPIVLENITVENAEEPEEDVGGDDPELPYEYDNTGFDLPHTDEEGVEYPELVSVADIKKSDIPLGGDFKGTGEDLINIEFDLEIPEGFTGGTIGYGSSQFQDAISHWSDMVLMIQFNNLEEYPDDSFNVRNGNAYVYAGSPWQVGTSHFKVTVDTKLKKYNVYYTAPGAADAVLIAENFDYRGDTASVTDSIGLMTFQGNEGENAVIKNHKIYGVGYSYVAPKEAKVVEEDRTEATVLTVGPSGKYPTLARALANAIPGDTIEIDAAGDYLGLNSNASIAVDNLTIRGVNGTPVFGYVDRTCAVPVTASKGIWVVSSKNLTVENIKFQNAHDAHEQHGNNYCGIRLEPVVDSTVTIKNCYFTGCDNGMLVGAAEGMTVKMQNCEFNDNGFGQMKDGNWSTQEHGMYMGMIENFYFDYSISRQIKAQGHLVKTRAANNYIRYSYIAEETTNGSHTSNSNIDIPEGGKLYVIGCVLQQGLSQPDLGNSRMISYAAEGANNADTLVVFANNTIVNEQTDVNEGRVAIYLHENNGKTYSNDNVYFVNNIYQGYRLSDDSVPVVATTGKVNGTVDKTAAYFSAANGNHIYNLSKAGDAAYAAANDPKFVDAANFDYHLQENSPLIDKGVEAVNVDEVELTPAYELDMAVVDNVGTASQGAIAVTRSIVGDAIDIGAFEFGNAGSTPEDPEEPEVPFDNKVSASIVGKEEVIYPDDVTFDVVLSKVEGLNLLALGFEYDPAVLTFKEIKLAHEGMEEVIPLIVNAVDGKISVTYGKKNGTITADDDTVWATLVFTSVEPGEEDVTATVEMYHFTASGVVNNGETGTQFVTEILDDTATTIVTKSSGFDVNKDGEINLADLSLILFNFNSNSAPACDVVRNGIVDVADVVGIIAAIREVNPDLLPPVVA